MSRLRISAISFLNTAPLMWDFERGEHQEIFDIDYTVPSRCAEALRTGAADIGIIPAISYQTIPDLAVLPEVAIAARGPVRSILLVSTQPLHEIHSVAVDTSSRTSVALLEILFAKFWRPRGGNMSSPAFTPMEPNLPTMLAACDAALLIGDPALTVDRNRYYVLDLAEEWKRSTGKPFVFAFWAARRQAVENHPLSGDLPRIFQRSRDHGLANVATIARDWAPRVGISEQTASRYLTSDISYTLDAENLAGLTLFYKLAAEVGIIARVRQLDLLPAGVPLPNPVP
ncbi:MAG: menaquinone biosynthesis protein [Acidobacteriales bacterium]|nr:menaquinone biosynthesis protein [Terriglobales bacterium]